MYEVIKKFIHISATLRAVMLLLHSDKACVGWRTYVRLGAYLLSSLCLFSVLPVAAESVNASPSASNGPPVGQTPPETKRDSGDYTLKPSESVQREISGGQSHFYSILLTKNQYLHITVDQRGIDLAIILFGSDGKEITYVDSPNGRQGPEELSAITETEGAYRLELRPLEKNSPPGSYELIIDALRTATLQDPNLVAAERAFNKGRMLRAEWTAVSLKKSAEHFQEAASLWRTVNDNRREATALYALGDVYSLLADYRVALANYHQALALSKAAGDRLTEADTLNSIGSVYNILGENQKSLDALSAALPLWRAIEDRQGEAITLSNLGVIYFRLGENRKALDCFGRTLEISRSINDRYTEAMVLNSIGLIYRLSGENQKAIDSFTQALALNRALGDRSGEAATLNNTGQIYFDLGDPQKALDYYLRSLPLIKAAGDRRMEAYSLSNIGTVYSALGDFKKAIEFYEQALAINRTIRNRSGESLALYGLGVAHSSEGDDKKALAFFEQALALSLEVGDRANEAQILSKLGAIKNLSGDYRKALTLLNRALEVSRSIKDVRTEASTLYWLARAERNMGDFTGSRQHLEAALTLIESQRVKISSQEVRASYVASVQKYYESYVDLLMHLHGEDPSAGLDALAWQTSERARARGFLELLIEAGVNIRQGVPSSLIDREKVLQQLLNSKAERQTRLLVGSHTKEQLAALGKEIEELSTEYQEVQAHIRRQSPRYADLTQFRPISLKEVQEQVVDNDTILLEYALGEDQSFLWVVTPTSVTSYALPKRREIEIAARSFQESLSKPGSSLDAAYQLSSMLLGPVAERLEAKRLLIVAQGPLLSLPFGALPLPEPPLRGTGSYSPLITRHEITYSPSASVLAVLRREMAGRKPAPNAVAVFADPVFSKYDARVSTLPKDVKRGGTRLPENSALTYQTAALKDVPTMGKAADGYPLARVVDSGSGAQQARAFPRLPTSRWEAQQILSLIPGSQSKLALDFDANRAAATSPELSQYRIIHFATHGIVDRTHPELSGIVLSSVDRQGNSQDGVLRANEIFNMNLSAELVVLSGCNTGLGKEVEGEGKIGLARAFMYAGAPRVVESLWDVDDRATAQLMVRFYKAMLKDGVTPAAALRRAQLEILEDDRWRHPYYWASFVLQGEWK